MNVHRLCTVSINIEGDKRPFLSSGGFKMGKKKLEKEKTLQNSILTKRLEELLSV